MHQLTHSGLPLIQRYNTSEAIEPALSDEEASEVLDAADLFAAIASRAIANAAGLHSEADRLWNGFLDYLERQTLAAQMLKKSIDHSLTFSVGHAE